MTERLTGFAPVCGGRPRVLVLGSMPGVTSLRMQQYYAHPRNGFWPIMASIIGFTENLSYAERCDALIASRVAVWDVLAGCERPGSLDADIRTNSAMPNDFADFFTRYDAIERILFNGGTAWDLYRRLVLPTMSAKHQALTRSKLPSTSPAYAAMPLAEKSRLWAAAFGG
ncbi:MAG: DNA-deoxyinosine glycosylase [Pseudomonadota bacterium]